MKGRTGRGRRRAFWECYGKDEENGEDMGIWDMGRRLSARSGLGNSWVEGRRYDNKN